MRAALLIAAESPRIEDALRVRPDLFVIDQWRGGDPAAALGRVRAGAPGAPVFMRIQSLERGGADELAAAMPAGPDGIWLRDAVGRADAERLAARLAVIEAELGLPDRGTRIVACVESARGALALPSLAETGPRLAGISYDFAALARDLGCASAGAARLPEPLAAIRAAVVVAAAAAGVPAIDSAGPALPDLDAFAGEAARARRDGFSAKLALSPDEAAVLRRLDPQAPLGRWMENFVSGVATK
ncbi:aldolase/citrate lyase family protein [Enterovirga aerilata]|uniref:HpcH/HpaI aldolase/citrate lyase domain-containing protein n=1 Tax=Enterovirga aerilata TaxID=2730920 RepID=A0A849I6F3_9HYPH|nr:aldolase/citrate lyase family protein [Enterovirga sp. DB1703]NNM73274.1 hypothetical protein [Enterovirga sp. DB1703]